MHLAIVLCTQLGNLSGTCREPGNLGNLVNFNLVFQLKFGSKKDLSSIFVLNFYNIHLKFLFG